MVEREGKEPSKNMKESERTVDPIYWTGGPSAGKSTVMAFVGDKLTQMGYHVLTVPEAATLCIMGGIHPGSEDIGVEVGQTAIIELNLAMKQVWEKVIRTAPTKKKMVWMFDRFLPDSKGYMPLEMYKRILRERGVHEAQILSSAKGIVFMVTAAFGTSGFTRENNLARREDPEGARLADLAIRDAWIGGPTISVIEPQEDFELKKLEALQVVLEMLGEPVPVEKEKKFIVRYRGDIPGAFQDSSIMQFYCLSDDPYGELRMRERITDGYVAYYQTKKVPNPLGEGRIEHEVQIPAAMFRLGYDNFRDQNYGTIRKRRRSGKRSR